MKTKSQVAREQNEEIDHLVSCPEKPERIESFITQRPARVVGGVDGPIRVPPRDVKVVRCGDCGQQSVIDIKAEEDGRG